MATTAILEEPILVNGVPQIEECRVVVCAANEVLVLGRDISDRKQAELALRESESRFRQLAETVREGFFVADPASFSYLYVNPAYETITGFSAPEVYANPRHWLDSIHPEDQESVAAALQQELQGLPFDQEYRFIRPDGTACWLRSQAFPILSETGELLRVVGTTEDITIRKQTEAALRESEERRRLALDLTSTGSWEFVVATGEAVWSDSQYRLMGLIPGEQASHFQTWRERVHPADLEWVEQQFTQALATRSLLETEYRVLYPDGTIRWVLTKGQGIYDATGEPIRMLGVMVDVTDRKLAEQALQQLNEELELRVEQRTQDLLASQLQLQAKEQFLRGVFEGTGNPIFVVDVQEDGAFQYTGWNRASEIISGVSSADVQGKSPQTLFPGAVGDALAANYRRCCEAGETIRYEEYLKFEQDDAWTLTTLTPLKDAAGRVHRIVGSAFDISERKRAELALQEAQRFTQSIADNTPNIIYIYDLNASRNIYANREVVELLGYVPEEIQSMGDHFLEVVSHPDDLARFGQIQQQIRQLADGQILEIEYRMRHRDGTWHWLYDRISVFNRDDAGAVIQFIGAAQDITDRKRAEAALAEKNAILQSVMESTPDVVYVKDAQGRYVIVNSGFVEFFGQPADQLLGRTDAELVPAAIAAQIAENDRQTIQSGVSHTIEEAVPRPDGSLRVYLTTKSPWRIPQGNQIGIVGLARDITERKLAEQALLESEQRYATLAAAVPVGIYRTSRSGDCLYVNERWCQIAGLTAAEALGTGWLKALHPDDCERIFQVWEQFVRTGSPFQLEYRFLRPDGIVTWVFGQAIQELDESGVIGYIGTITDITERKQAEAQLREQEQFLRSIYEGVQQPIFVGDVLPDQSIRMASWNPAAAKLTGISSEEVAGKAVMDIFLPDQAAEMLARYAQSITTGRPATFEERITFQNQTRWMLSTYNPLINSEGQVHRVVGTVYDITDRKQLEQELRQINLELEQRVAERTQDLQQAMEAAQMASRAKTTFLSNMSHELRTPLNAILGFGQLLSRDNLLNLDQQEQIEIINRSGEHLLALINDVLAMSKIEAGQTTLNISRFNLGDLLRDLDALFQLKAETKQLRLTVQTDPQIPHLIQTDESKLRQVLINLVGNAIKFTERGSVTVRVWPEADAHPSANPGSLVRLHFEVEDTGFGIAPEEQELVFDPFGQTQSGRNSQEGTGLGLPISRQFVQLMGG
ncbi:MAG: PAS domain S-box protein, partial [Elainella sp.]